MLDPALVNKPLQPGRETLLMYSIIAPDYAISKFNLSVNEFDNVTSENLIKMLITAGANIDFQDCRKNTALLFAGLNYLGMTGKNTIKMLLNARANIYLCDEYGLTPLMWVISRINYNTGFVKNNVKTIVEYVLDDFQHFEFTPLI